MSDKIYLLLFILTMGLMVMGFIFYSNMMIQMDITIIGLAMLFLIIMFNVNKEKVMQ